MPSPILSIRVSEDLMQDLKKLVIEKRKRSQKFQMYTVTDFLHEAIREKLNHILRGRRLSKQRAKRQQTEREAIRYKTTEPVSTGELVKRYFARRAYA